MRAAAGEKPAFHARLARALPLRRAAIPANAASSPDRSREAGRRLEVKQLYVAEDWIGTGLGGALMRRVLEEFPEAAQAVHATLADDLADLVSDLDRVRGLLDVIDGISSGDSPGARL